MNWQSGNLQELRLQIWRRLEGAVKDADDPFRTPVFVTAGRHGYGVRVVVLRLAAAANRTLCCYSDFRTPKLRDIETDPNVQWLFFDPAARAQIRIRACASIHHLDAIARESWKHVPASNKINYCASAPPGSELAEPDGVLAPSGRQTELAPGDLDLGIANFAVLETIVESFDWLQLTPNGNVRAGFAWDGYAFAGRWLVA